LTGVSTRSIRHYTSIGLIKSFEKKSIRKTRTYTPHEVNKIKIINSLRELGLNLNEIGCILESKLVDVIDFKVDKTTPSRSFLIEKLKQKKIEIDLIFEYLEIK
jgi:DNA-binding transcriptional MerR regulator